MGPKTKQLIKTLDSIVELLQDYSVEHWAAKVALCKDKLEQLDSAGLTQFLGLLGGMGALNDVLLIESESEQQIDWEATELLRTRLSEAYSLATTIQYDLGV